MCHSFPNPPYREDIFSILCFSLAWTELGLFPLRRQKNNGYALYGGRRFEDNGAKAITPLFIFERHMIPFDVLLKGSRGDRRSSMGEM